MPGDLQALGEQALDLIGSRAPGGLKKASLHPQHFRNGPSLAGLVRNCESLLDGLQRGIIPTCLGVNLCLERQKDRQPQPRACFAPRGQSTA